jgi:hypothetical protein
MPKDLKTLRLESRAKPKVGTGDSTDLVNYKIALRMITMNADATDPLLKFWCLKYGPAGALSMADSVSLASSAFPGNAKVQKKLLESRDLKTNENRHMIMINRTLDDKIRPRAVTLEHGVDSNSTARELAQEPVTENPY